MKTRLVGVVFCFFFALCQAQEPTVSSRDRITAGWEFQNSIDAGLDIRKLSLKDGMEKWPDGALGYKIQASWGSGTAPFKGERKHDIEVELARHACNEQIVVAKAGTSSSFFIHEDRGIATAYSFAIEKVLQGDLTTGSSITVIEFGGSVFEGPAEYRVGLSDFKNRAFQDGHDYLLFVRKFPGHPSDAYLMSDLARVPVDDGRIKSTSFPYGNLSLPIMNAGESIAKLQTEIVRSRPYYPCVAYKYQP